MFKRSFFCKTILNLPSWASVAVFNLSLCTFLLHGCSAHHSHSAQSGSLKSEEATAFVTLTKMPLTDSRTDLPKGYSRLFEVDHSILLSPRALPETKPIILPTRAAEALRAVNKEAKEQGFNLVVYRSEDNELDVTLITLGNMPHLKVKTEAKLYNHEPITYYDDGTFNMGTSYLDESEASHHGSSLVSPQAAVMRNYLRALMNKHGFKAETLWWRYHFS